MWSGGPPIGPPWSACCGRTRGRFPKEVSSTVTAASRLRLSVPARASAQPLEDRAGKRWTDAEIETLYSKYPNTPGLLLAAELGRSWRAVRRKAFALNVKRAAEDYTATSLAAAMRVHPQTVLGWIRRGWLHAETRTEGATQADSAGWRITAADVRQFMRCYPSAVPPGLDPVWYIDVLAGIELPYAASVIRLKQIDKDLLARDAREAQGHGHGHGQKA